MICRRVLALFLSMLLLVASANGGGPRHTTGPANSKPGQPFVWDNSKTISYTVDSGPLSVSPSGQTVIDNAAGLARVKSLFQNWQSVPTAFISMSYAGTIKGLASGSDVKTIQDYNTVVGTCNSGTQNPIIFDADGSLVSALGLDALVIGFNSTCNLNLQTGFITGSLILLNGKFQDGVNDPQTQNYELSADQFDEAITHEMGHFLGLDHSQINLDLYQNATPGSCNADELAGLPLMFPVFFCQSRKSAGLPILAPDDVAWISKLYPNINFSANYGTISGFIFFSDGITHVQGLNVIARRVDDPTTPEDESKRIAVSVVSGFQFTGNPGQSITGDNTGGSSFGSRNPALIGYYEIPVPPGSYTIQTEVLDSSFVGDSSIGPLSVPSAPNGSAEYWHAFESAFDDPTQKDPIPVLAGQKVSNINIILNGTPPRFDPNEDGEVRLRQPSIPFIFRPARDPWRLAVES
jgi:hypothetical protein